MGRPTITRRTTLAGLMGGAATLTAAVAVPRRAWASAQPAVSASDDTLTIVNLVEHAQDLLAARIRGIYDGSINF